MTGVGEKRSCESTAEAKNQGEEGVSGGENSRELLGWGHSRTAFGFTEHRKPLVPILDSLRIRGKLDVIRLSAL